MRTQLALMRLFDEARTRMETAIALDTFESEPSRWARGSRLMPLESCLRLIRLDLADHPERVTRALRILLDGLDHEPIPVVDLEGEGDELRTLLRSCGDLAAAATARDPGAIGEAIDRLRRALALYDSPQQEPAIGLRRIDP